MARSLAPEIAQRDQRDRRDRRDERDQRDRRDQRDERDQRDQRDDDEGRGDLADIVRRALRPPLRDRRFWTVQVVVVVLAALHLLVDLHSAKETGAFPGGIPVDLLIIPVGYAALRYGLTGSAATAAWASLLWLPDLLLPFDQGHAPSDVVNLLLVDGVALFFGQRIEAERRAHVRVERATLGRLAAEAGYRQLFEANRAPILVVDAHDVVRAANPAAVALFGDGVIGMPAPELVDAGQLAGLQGRVVTLDDGHDYRVAVAELPEGGDAAAQVVFEDVTEERSETRRAARQRALMIAAEEEQRRRLARELHDEPLQLLLHLARRFETLGESTGVPAAVASSLEDARVRALEAATRLRNLARDLRPPALDQLGLVPALSSFLAEAEEDSGILVDLEVSGEMRRLHPDVELGAFRIVQEAVRNALRHANAREVHVGLAFASDVVRLHVMDDGVGFVVADADGSGQRRVFDGSAEHLGLVGMAERASLLGGQLDVHSVPGRGTDVRAWLPGEPGGSPTRAA
jgi:signal transduction histidine kinase